MPKPKKIPISVFIIAKDEEERIHHTIKSVIGWADEVLVIDSGSKDKTCEIATSLGAKVIFNEWKGYGPQKIFGENKCRNDWILNLDADEALTDELTKEIQDIFHTKMPSCSAFKIRWKMLFLNKNKAPLFAPGAWFVRLYNKKHAGFKDSIIHDSVVIHSGKTEKLKHTINHRCFRNLTHWCDKINYYSSLQAIDYTEKNRNPYALRIIFEPFFAFFKAYFLRRYILYGVNGFVGSMLYAHARMLRLAKAKEILDQRNI